MRSRYDLIRTTEKYVEGGAQSFRKKITILTHNTPDEVLERYTVEVNTKSSFGKGNYITEMMSIHGLCGFLKIHDMSLEKMKTCIINEKDLDTAKKLWLIGKDNDGFISVMNTNNGGK